MPGRTHRKLTGHLQGSAGTGWEGEVLFTVCTFWEVECPIMCLCHLFKIALKGGCEVQPRLWGAWEDPLPSKADSQGCPQKPGCTRVPGEAASRCPTAKVCFQLPDNPTYFLWHGILATPPPHLLGHLPCQQTSIVVGCVPSLGEEPVTATSHNFKKALGPAVHT